VREAEVYERNKKKAVDMIISLDIISLDLEKLSSDIDIENRFYTVLIVFNGRRVYETEGTVGGTVPGGRVFLRKPNNR
jgi:hypothetical protein